MLVETPDGPSPAQGQLVSNGSVELEVSLYMPHGRSRGSGQPPLPLHMVVTVSPTIPHWGRGVIPVMRLTSSIGSSSMVSHRWLR